MMHVAPHLKPVQLQLNNSGAWKTIVKFDLVDKTTSYQLMEAARSIQRVDGKARFRIATAEAIPHALMYLEDLTWRNA